jgi:ABC-type transport system substrate-binding protein
MPADAYSHLLRWIPAAALGLALLAAPAFAQKGGGTATLGMELDIPGFDPLKVGVYDTAARSAAALIFDTLTRLDDEGLPSRNSRDPGPPRKTSKSGPSNCSPGSSFPTALHSMRKL